MGREGRDVGSVYVEVCGGAKSGDWIEGDEMVSGIFFYPSVFMSNRLLFTLNCGK